LTSRNFHEDLARIGDEPRASIERDPPGPAAAQMNNQF
jgi:hypothetical protein